MKYCFFVFFRGIQNKCHLKCNNSLKLTITTKIGLKMFFKNFQKNIFLKTWTLPLMTPLRIVRYVTLNVTYFSGLDPMRQIWLHRDWVGLLVDQVRGVYLHWAPVPVRCQVGGQIGGVCLACGLHLPCSSSIWDRCLLGGVGDGRGVRWEGVGVRGVME